ncbi:hypothetical protein [Vibrio alginolyticus]|uniref:hypothetical protein n=1 Tax=Vibrio alginolyticus TaxID=663 RepID=UPI0006CA6760|nr:hypothetical protein [Vibrio alginolyticus]KPM97464.1 hypothetical protein AOG25_13405 [Vibrio alginolyticus]CAH7186124.1 conserved hypothetical protein [Vibrio chagasii]CAH7355108.1 conserved hypothetical protein [Vibrio chagasii]
MDYSKLSVAATDGSTQSVLLHPITTSAQVATGFNNVVDLEFEESLLSASIESGTAFETSPSVSFAEASSLLRSDLLVVRTSYLWAGHPCDADDTETLTMIIDEQRQKVVFDGYIVANDKSELDVKIQEWCDFQNDKLKLLNSNLNKLSSNEYSVADKKDGFISMLTEASKLLRQ